MKTIIASIVFLIISMQSNAQEVKPSIDTASFQVRGVCNMCKDRIENAALIKGVKWVEWNKETEQLTVIYKTSKVKLNDIHKSIAEAGHTTEKVKCNIEAYNKLPKCCAYDSEAEKH